MNFVQIAEFDWLPWQHKGQIFEKYSKIFSLEALWGMKLKFCIHIHDISLYTKCVLYCHCPCAFIGILIMSKLQGGEISPFGFKISTRDSARFILVEIPARRVRFFYPTWILMRYSYTVNHPKFSDRQVWANSVDPDPEGAV